MVYQVALMTTTLKGEKQVDSDLLFKKKPSDTVHLSAPNF